MICIRLSTVLLIRILFTPLLSQRLYKAFAVLAQNSEKLTQLSLKTLTDVPYPVSRHENCDFLHDIKSQAVVRGDAQTTCVYATLIFNP
jgi:hypothetical protein